MLANWVKQTTATTGTGTIDLIAAASGFADFIDGIANGDLVHYTIQDGNDFEEGVGTLTDAATDTLSRTHIITTLVSGTYTSTPDGSGTAITLASGTKDVFIAAVASQFIPIIKSLDSGYYRLPYNLIYNFDGKGGGEFTSGAGDIVFTPVVIPWPELITTIYAEIRTVSAGGNCRLGLYDTEGANGKPLNLIFDSGNISTASTGFIGATLGSPKLIFPGRYYAASAVDNTTAAARGARLDGSNTKQNFAGVSSATGVKFIENVAYAAFPSTATPVRHNNWADFGIYWR